MVQEVRKFTPEKIRYLEPHQVMVFGANLLGLHKGGAAKDAMEFGAEMRVAVGLRGQTYALPTKANFVVSLPLKDGPTNIKREVQDFIEFAKQHPQLEFLVTKVGCFRAGYTVEDIAPFFAEALQLSNVVLPREFYEHLTKIDELQ